MNEERLRAARYALRLVEEEVGIIHRVSFDPEPGAHGGGVFLVPTSRSFLVRALIDALPEAGWAAFVAVPDMGWQAAEADGLELSRTLVIADPGGHVAQCCDLLLDAVDVICIESDALSFQERRRLAARAHASSRLILTTIPWEGISREWVPRLREAI